MTNEEERHLNEDQLRLAVIDDTDLPASLRDHLKICPVCRAEKERFEENLARLGHMAERLAPSPSRKVKLPVQESAQRPLPWYWNWRGALAAGMATGVLALVIVGGSMLVKTTREAELASLTQEMWEDDQLMTEISELAENALPAFCLDIAGEPDPDFDEEFIDFVIPATEGDLVSRNGGGVPC